MKELFALGRNDPCPCGSGRKHKRCCQEAVRRFRAALREGLGPAAAVMPHLLDVLALVCGVRPGPGEDRPPDAEEVAAALRHCHAELLDPDREPEYERIVQRLAAVLRRCRQLRLLRFPMARLSPLLKEDGPAGPDLVRRLVTGDFATRAAEAFALALRAAAGDRETLRAAVTALYCLLEARDTQLVGTAVLRATLEDWGEAEDLLAAASGAAGADEGEEGWIEEIREKYPFLLVEAADRHRSEAAEALRAIADGRLKIDIPLYAVLAGVHTVRSELVRALAGAVCDRRRLNQELRETFVRLSHPEGVLRQAAVSDFPLFAAAAERELTAAAEAAEGPLRQGLEALRAGLDLADLPLFSATFFAFYLGIILRVLEGETISVPRRGGPPAVVPVFALRAQHLAEYAAYLEEQGEGEAALRVRELAALFDRRSLTAEHPQHHRVIEKGRR
ncbi:MAG: SEC-C domain-containing protein [Desulfotomaculales bacterium]